MFKMRRKRQWMLVAILTCGLGLLVTSCSERDELEAGSASAAARAAEKQQLVGEWCVEYKESGSVESSKGDMSYTSVIERYLFKEDGTGLWARYFLSDESVYPVAEWGGSGSGVFSYAIGNGGELAIHFLPEKDVCIGYSRRNGCHERTGTGCCDTLFRTGADAPIAQHHAGTASIRQP